MTRARWQSSTAPPRHPRTPAPRHLGALALAVSLLASLVAVGAAGLFQAPARDREAGYRANNVGISFLEQFDYDKAAASFRQALQVDAGLDIARLNLALALFYGNDADGALREARAAAARMPDSPQVHYVLGLLARSQNRTEDAIAEFRRVLQRDPDDVGSKVNLGQVYLQERNYDAALALVREALAAEPFNVTAAYNLATALVRSGAQAEGQAAMERFQTLRDSAYGNTYAQTYLAQGKYAEALASTGAEPDLVERRDPGRLLRATPVRRCSRVRRRPTVARRPRRATGILRRRCDARRR